MIDAAAALVRYPRVHQARPQQFVQPLQPARHQEEEEVEEEEEDNFDVLNAPPQYQKQSGMRISRHTEMRRLLFIMPIYAVHSH